MANFKRKNKTHRAATKATDDWTTPKNIQRENSLKKAPKMITTEEFFDQVGDVLIPVMKRMKDK